VREIATKFLETNPGKGVLRRIRKRSALAPRFRETTTNPISNPFGPKPWRQGHDSGKALALPGVRD
jgi:hypothetical protein